jgi:8-oxo-dGTP pyrophosphatase MutT (NUDIX family)
MVKDDSSPTQGIPQVCVIPFRRREEVWEFCLVTSLKKKRWIFPKGIVDPGETPQQSGLKEAWEEAGLRGEIVGSVVDHFTYEKWGTVLHVDVLLMQVDRVEDQWPEADQRQRCWLNGRDALDRIGRSALREALLRARQQLFHGRIAGEAPGGEAGKLAPPGR